MSEYPNDWPVIALRIKEAVGWKCERCRHPHDVESGHVLTVHHLVPDKALVADWNLAALCQRCHLSIQAHIDMFQEIFPFIQISEWFKPHLAGFREWQKQKGAA